MSIENPNNWEDYHEDDTKSHSLDNSQIISIQFLALIKTSRQLQNKIQKKIQNIKNRN